MTSWFKNVLSALVGAAAGALIVFIVKPCPTKTLVLPSKPIYDTLTINDTVTIARTIVRMRPAAIDTLTKPPINALQPRRDTITVHLASYARPEYGLDSVTADYLYPPGWRQFVFWPADSLGKPQPASQSPLKPLPIPGLTAGGLRVGIEAGAPVTHPLYTGIRAYLGFPIRYGEALIGYEARSRSSGVWLGWRKELRLF